MKKKLTVLALAFAMVLTMSASVFAANPAGQNTGEGGVDSYSAGQANLVKYVQIPEGVDLTKAPIKDQTFTFHFAATNSTVSSEKNYGVPASVFSDQDFDVTTAAISAMSAATQTAAGQNDEDTQNKVWAKSIAEIFANAHPNKENKAFVFPRAGEYTFTVTETGTAPENWEYAKDQYLLRLIVDKDGNIDDVTVQELVTDPEKPNDPPTPGAKVDPTDVTPGDNTGTDDPDTLEDESKPSPADSNGGFTFTNLYKPTVTTHDEPGNDPDAPNPPEDPKNPDPTPNDPDHPTPIDKDHPELDQNHAFELDKYVLGEYGDQTNPFTFPVKVTLPKSDATFNVVKENNVAGGTLTKDADNGRVYTGTITLTHGQKFTIHELPVGTKIEVAETGPIDGYTQLMTTSKTTTVDEGVSDAPATTAVEVRITEGEGGYAIVRNSFHDENVTPTGIIINNLPYVLLIGLAIGGIVLFSRKKRYE